MKRMALGEDDRTLNNSDEIKSISGEETFLVDTVDRSQLRECLRTQAADIALRLQRRRLGASTVQVKVRPRLALRRVAAHWYAIRLTAAQSFAGKYVSFQRYNGTLKRWVSVRSVLLKASSTGVAPTGRSAWAPA